MFERAMQLRGTAYHPELGELIEYRAYPLPEEPDLQVAQTVNKMAEHIREDAASEPIQREAAAIQSFGTGDPLADTFWWVKGKVGFQQDEALAAPVWPGDGNGGQVIEVLIRPRHLAQMRQPLEDCDGFASYAPALLRAQGVPCNLVTVAADWRDPSRFSHVYAACYPNGERIPLDVSHGPYPGWECTGAGPVWRMKEWAIDGPSWGEIVIMAGLLFLAAKLVGFL